MADKTPMKIVKMKSMGGSGKQTVQQAVDAGEDFDKKLAAYKQRMKAHTAVIKRWLARGIKQVEKPADYTSMSVALLELAFERYLDLHGEEDAHDLIERAFRRVVKERRGLPN